MLLNATLKMYKHPIAKNLCIDIYSAVGALYSNEFIFFHPHQDEPLSLQLGKNFVDENGGCIVSVLDINSPNTRHITINLEEKIYTIDPNRMFTEYGIRNVANIKNETAIAIITDYAKKITSILSKYSTIIALHNNDNENYSINHYMGEGKNNKEATYVYYNPEYSTANFFITNNYQLWTSMKEVGFSAVFYGKNNTLKENNKGYLSVYVENYLQGATYINVEAYESDLLFQTNMLLFLKEKLLTK